MDLTEKQLDEVIQEVNRRCPESAKEEAVEAVALDYILQKAVHLEQVEMG